MKKFYYIQALPVGFEPAGNNYYSSKEDAVNAAKRQAATKGRDTSYNIVVFEATQTTEVPVPDIKMVDLTD